MNIRLIMLRISKARSVMGKSRRSREEEWSGRAVLLPLASWGMLRKSLYIIPILQNTVFKLSGVSQYMNFFVK